MKAKWISIMGTLAVGFLLMGCGSYGGCGGSFYSYSYYTCGGGCGGGCGGCGYGAVDSTHDTSCGLTTCTNNDYVRYYSNDAQTGYRDYEPMDW